MKCKVKDSHHPETKSKRRFGSLPCPSRDGLSDTELEEGGVFKKFQGGADEWERAQSLSG